MRPGSPVALEFSETLGSLVSAEVWRCRDEVCSETFPVPILDTMLQDRTVRTWPEFMRKTFQEGFLPIRVCREKFS